MKLFVEVFAPVARKLGSTALRLCLRKACSAAGPKLKIRIPYSKITLDTHKQPRGVNEVSVPVALHIQRIHPEKHPKLPVEPVYLYLTKGEDDG